MKPLAKYRLHPHGPPDGRIGREYTGFGQFDHGQLKVAREYGEDFHTPPTYFLQLLAFAQSTPYDELGVERQRFRPECLRRYETDGMAPAAGADTTTTTVA